MPETFRKSKLQCNNITIKGQSVGCTYTDCIFYPVHFSINAVLCVFATLAFLCQNSETVEQSLDKSVLFAPP